jgi:charged multivesicular body protein 2A
MSFLFGGNPPSTAELARRYKQHINRSIRDLDREYNRIALEEKQLMKEVKIHSNNNLKLSFQKAQAVVRSRRLLSKFSLMKANMQGISMRIQSVKTTDALQSAVQSAVSMMQNFNKLAGGTKLMGSLQEMEKHNAFMNFQSEIIDDQLDSIFEEDNDEESTHDIVSQILFEAGVNIPSTSHLFENSSIDSQILKCKVPTKSVT